LQAAAWHTFYRLLIAPVPLQGSSWFQKSLCPQKCEWSIFRSKDLPLPLIDSVDFTENHMWFHNLIPKNVSKWLKHN
jgi:hypothetical protein